MKSAAPRGRQGELHVICLPTSHKNSLLERMRSALRRKHYVLRTGKAYLGWVRRFISFHDKQHPAHMGAEHIEAFLDHLAADRKMAASAQNLALSAILFRYRHVLGLPIETELTSMRARRRAHLPVVLSRTEVASLLSCLTGTNRLLARLL